MPRARLLQFVAPNDGPAIWLPATEGLWEWRLIFPHGMTRDQDGTVHRGVKILADVPRLFIIRGLGPREDDALCMPVTTAPDGTIKPDASRGVDYGQVKSCRELPAGYWTFIRPLQEGDPEIPGA